MGIFSKKLIKEADKAASAQANKSKGQRKAANARVEPAKKTPLKISDVKRMYGRPSSFIDKLPWVEWQSDSNTILLDDGISVMAVMDVRAAAPTEGRAEELLQGERNKIADIISDTFDESHQAEWVISTYAGDDENVSDFVDKLRAYPNKFAQGTQFTESYLDTLENHLLGISKEGGLFYDNEVMDANWGGKMRRMKVVIYRRLPRNWKSEQDMTPEEELNNVCEKFIGAMREPGVILTRDTGREFYNFMLQWFNPKPSMTNGDRRAFYEAASFPDQDELPWGDDFAESMFFTLPKSHAERNAWEFDGMLHQYVRVNKIRSAPKVGAVTGEVKQGGDRAGCMMDKLPPGSIVQTTLIITPQDKVDAHLSRIYEKSRGESMEATYAREDVEVAQSLMAHKQKLYRFTMGVYIRGSDMKELRTNYNTVRSQLLSARLQPYDVVHDPIGLDAYILNLPGVFETTYDNTFKMSRPAWAQHVASLLGFMGRYKGTDNIGMMMYNRGGEMLTLDPLSNDKRKNSHGIVIGPTGSGKSVFLATWISHIIAMHRPRTIIVEAGNSFGLLADYYRSQGLTVNHISIKPGSGVSLAPFQSVHLLIESERDNSIKVPESLVRQFIPTVLEEEGSDKPYAELSPEQQADIYERAKLIAIAERSLDESETGDLDDNDDQRDILGEAEIVAKLMITGGEEEEAKRLRRSDRRMIRDAILLGARKAVDQGRTTLVSDVADGFEEIYKQEHLPADARTKAYEMGQSLRMYCDGFEGEVFNAEAAPWPDVDVTILDLATFARDGYQAQLAIAYTSIMQNCNNLAERFQHSGRQIFFATDEAHLVTTNPLLSGFIVKIVKMFRKLSVAYWLATQNLEDFPNEAKKLLNMVEWFVALVMPPEEVEQMARFRQMTDDEKAMMLSARKEPRKYTEGVVMSDNIQALFRNVPPSLYLSLAGTEGSEKAERGEVMREFGITEVEAAQYIAAKIDHGRGIGPKPDAPVPNLDNCRGAA